jgi:hypothetical protein
MAFIVRPLPLAYELARTTILSASGGARPTDWTFARPTSGYYTDSSGVLTLAAANAERLDYEGGVLQGLLMEPATHNLLLQGDAFDNASWTKNNTTISANSTTAPDGTSTADRLIETATAGVIHETYQDITKIASALPYSFSFFLKAWAGSRRCVIQLLAADSSWNVYSIIDLPNGVVSSQQQISGGSGHNVTNTTTTLETLGSGWYRVKLENVVSSVATTVRSRIILDSGSGNAALSHTYTGNTSSGIYVWGAQLEQSRFCTSYTNFNSQNLLLQSETFGTTWVPSGATISASNTVLAPNATLTADVMTETAVTSFHLVYQDVTKPAVSALYSVSVHAKAMGTTARRFAMSIEDNVGGNHIIAQFDLIAGTVAVGPTQTGTGVTGGTASLEYVGDGWCRCKLEGVTHNTATNLRTSNFLWGTGGVGSYLGVTTASVALWGAQLEQAAACTPYVPTTSHRLGRAADTASGTADTGVTDVVVNKEDGGYYPVDATAGQTYGLVGS